jgi:hypothetical protein
MIDPANEILRDLIQSRLGSLAGVSQVGFEPPNEDWRSAVAAAGEERLNLYLYDMKENRRLRTNERQRETHQGWERETPAPPRLDCHYLATAWSPVTFSPPTVEPTRDEHLRLYDVAEVLLRHRALAPAEVYQSGVVIPSGRTLSSVPASLREGELPLQVAQAEGAANLSEFWSTMKVSWRPALHVTVTVPVLLLESEREFPSVTTLGVEYRMSDPSASGETLLSLGGHVAAGSAAAPVKGAWVQVLGLAPPAVQAVNRRLVTGADGRFVFSRLPAGRYRLRVVASGLGDLLREVDLPSETGEYDVSFP